MREHPLEFCESQNDIVECTLRAYSLARSAVLGAGDSLIRNAGEACAAIDVVQQKFDELDETVEDRLAELIEGALQPARDLLTCLRAIVNLASIGRLAENFAQRARNIRSRITEEDTRTLLQMCVALDTLLREGSEAFATRDIQLALAIVRADAELDRLRNLVVFRHTDDINAEMRESFHVLALAQTLERAGDQAKNVAEDVCRMVTGRSPHDSMRHKHSSLEQMYLGHLFEKHAVRMSN